MHTNYIGSLGHVCGASHNSDEWKKQDLTLEKLKVLMAHVYANAIEYGVSVTEGVSKIIVKAVWFELQRYSKDTT